jgi:hypothetical protein
MRALTEHQPYADLIMAGVKDVVNRTRPVPSTLPQWRRCQNCGMCCAPDDIYVVPCESTAPHLTKPDGPFPFRLGIHAAASVDRLAAKRPDIITHAAAVADLPSYCDGDGPIPALGVLLGFVTVTGQHHADECAQHRGQYRRVHDGYEQRIDYCSQWALPDGWHYALTDPEPLDTPLPMKGQPGFWQLPETK